jgi:signal transduction histidine kinase
VRRLVIANVLVFVAYLATGLLGLRLEAEATVATVVWPPSGIALAGMLLTGGRVWPAIALAAFCTNATIALAPALLIAFGNTAAAIIAYRLIEDHRPFCLSLERVDDVTRLIVFGAGLGPLISATVGSISSWAAGLAPLAAVPHLLSTWWLGDMVGVLTVAPLILVWAVPGVMQVRTRKHPGLLALILAITMLVGFALLYGQVVSRAAIAFIGFPFFIWLAARWGQRWTVTGLFIGAVTLIAANLAQLGPFALAPTQADLTHLQAAIGVYAISIMSLAAGITEILDQRQQFEEQKQTLDEAEQLGRSGSWSWDVRQDQFLWSDGMYRNHGLHPGSFPPTLPDLMRLVYPADRTALEAAIQEALTTGKPFDCRHRIMLAGGQVRTVRARGRALRDADGKVIKLFGTCQDTTVEEAQKKLQSEFITLASHELRTPVTIMQGALQLLHNYRVFGLTPEQQQIQLRRIENQIQHIVRISADLQDASYVESGVLPFHTQRVELPAMLASIADDWQVVAKQHGVRLQVVPPGASLPPVWADPVRLRQILGELIDNAIASSPEGGLIDLRVAAAPETVRMTVTDHGKGFSAAEMQHLFEPFYRGEPNVAGSRGLGLGLFLTREFVRRHGGELTARSQPGIETTFTFTVPIYAAKGDTASGTAAWWARPAA